jgi:hypothetical protein
LVNYVGRRKRANKKKIGECGDRETKYENSRVMTYDLKT